MNVLTREDLAQGFSIHESVTLSTIWPAQPCFNNLVTFDPVKPLETFDTVVPELAEKWSWQDGYVHLQVGAELHGLLRRGGGEAHRAAIAGAELRSAWPSCSASRRSVEDDAAGPCCHGATTTTPTGPT